MPRYRQEKTASKSWRWVLGFFALLLLAILICIAVAVWQFAPRSAPGWLREKILTSVHDSCPRCVIEIGAVQIDFSNRQVSFSDFVYDDAPGHHSKIDVSVKSLEITFELKDLKDFRKFLHKQFLVSELSASGVDFTVFEDSRIHSPPDHSEPLSGMPQLLVRHISVEDSQFKYIHQPDLHDPKKTSPTARLLLTHIRGTTGAWATRRALAQAYALKRTPIEASGVLEHSGTFHIQAEDDPLSELGDLHLSISVKDQPLQLVNGFFEYEANFKLEGQLFSVSTTLDMKEGKIHGLLRAQYSGLKIQVADPESSGVSNFLATLGTKIVVHREQGVNGKPEGKSEVDDVRTLDQSLLSGIFQALGKSTKQLVTH